MTSSTQQLASALDVDARLTEIELLTIGYLATTNPKRAFAEAARVGHGPI